MNVYFCGCGEWSGLVSMILKLEMRTSMIELRLEISLWGFLSGNACGAGECVGQIAGFEECCPGGLLSWSLAECCWTRTDRCRCQLSSSVSLVP